MPEVLGHSDPSLTANVYTDVPALSLHSEMAKIPWITEAKHDAQIDAQKSGAPGLLPSLADILRQIQLLAETAGIKGVSPAPASSDASCRKDEMAAQAGIEPATK